MGRDIRLSPISVRAQQGNQKRIQKRKSDGHNEAFSDGLKLFDRYYIGPMMMPTGLFHRCCGPEKDMTYHIDSEWFYAHVADNNVRRAFDVLRDGGVVIDAIHELPWSKCCATVIDKYGVCWWIAI